MLQLSWMCDQAAPNTMSAANDCDQAIQNPDDCAAVQVLLSPFHLMDKIGQ